MTLYRWSQSQGSNSSADPTINWAEGQAPSTVNDSARAMMAAVAKYRDDTAGAIVTGGASTAYTVSSFEGFDTLAHLSGQVIGFVPNITSTNAVGVDVTLNVDGLGAKPIRMQPNVTLPGGTLISGTPYVVTYNNSDGVFYLQGMTNPYAVPLGGLMDFVGTSVPNSCYVFPIGQAISRTTYATLFSLVSTTYGTGDGSTTFNLPDLTGRTVAMKEATATRLTTAGSGVDGGTLGASGGNQNKTLLTANLPPYTPAGSIVVTANGNNNPQVVNGNSPSIAQPTVGSGTAYFPTSQFFGLSATFTGTAQGGTSTPVATVQPTIVLNKILRVI